MSRRFFTYVVAAAAALAVGVVAAIIVFKAHDSGAPAPAIPGQIRVSADMPIGGPFALTDQNGRRVTDIDFRGRFMLVYFGYTFCPDVCPTELNTIALAMKALGDDAGQVVPVFITVDPARDTPAAMKAYLASFGPEFVGLTGSDQEIAAAAKAYRVYYKKADGSDPDSYTVDHTSLLYLMGRDGKIAALFRTGATPEDLAAGIRAALTLSSPAATE
jgi:protein SCO1/2